MRGPSGRRWLPATALALLVSAAAPQLVAAPKTAAELAAQQRNLIELRRRVESLQSELAAAEETLGDATEALRTSEKAISDGRRRIFEIGRERAQLVASLAELDRQISARSGEIDRQWRLLGRLAVRQSLDARADPLRIILGGGDPNEIARRLEYLRVLNAARAEVLAELRAQTESLRDTREMHRQRREALAALAKEQEAAVASLETERRTQQAVASQIAAQAAQQRRELATLLRNEARLARLVDRLRGIVEGLPSAPSPPSSSGGDEARNRTRAADGIAARKGRLAWPVRGELSNRFGSRREGGGPPWTGIVIRCAPGSAVRAVAPGQVVFADWLRGFGNLVVLDHGGGFMSLYGYNDSLLLPVGTAVDEGDVIAHSGSSGGGGETGLYFEIRQLGQALDPTEWVGR